MQKALNLNRQSNGAIQALSLHIPRRPRKRTSIQRYKKHKSLKLQYKILKKHKSKLNIR